MYQKELFYTCFFFCILLIFLLLIKVIYKNNYKQNGYTDMTNYIGFVVIYKREKKILEKEQSAVK